MCRRHRRRRSQRATRSTSLFLQSGDGPARRCSRALVIHKNSSVTRGPFQCRYDDRSTRRDTNLLKIPVKIIFQEHSYSFKISLSYRFFLRNKDVGRYKFYHSSCNCCGRYLVEPSLIINSEDFDAFLERIRETDVFQWATNQRPYPAWVCELVRNITFFVSPI